jgi:hypothetical protein
MCKGRSKKLAKKSNETLEYEKQVSSLGEASKQEASLVCRPARLYGPQVAQQQQMTSLAPLRVVRTGVAPWHTVLDLQHKFVEELQQDSNASVGIAR